MTDLTATPNSKRSMRKSRLIIRKSTTTASFTNMLLFPPREAPGQPAASCISYHRQQLRWLSLGSYRAQGQGSRKIPQKAAGTKGEILMPEAMSPGVQPQKCCEVDSLTQPTLQSFSCRIPFRPVAACSPSPCSPSHNATEYKLHCH